MSPLSSRTMLRIAGSLGALVVASTFGVEAAADDDTSIRDTVVAHGVTVRLRVPPTVTYDKTRLGHVLLPTRVSLTNTTRSPVPLGARRLDLVARGTLRVHPCEERGPIADRLPPTLDPGTTSAVDRTIACETSLPGAYVLEARWSDAPREDAPLASVPFRIEPGSGPPVPLSTRPALHAIATGTREVVPAKAAGQVRIVLALTNATSRPVNLPALVVETSLHLRGSPLTCKDRREIALTGELDAGAQHVVWMPLACALPSEGTWEVDVDVGEPSGPPVRLPSHVVHASALPTPLPTQPR